MNLPKAHIWKHDVTHIGVAEIESRALSYKILPRPLHQTDPEWDQYARLVCSQLNSLERNTKRYTR